MKVIYDSLYVDWDWNYASNGVRLKSKHVYAIEGELHVELTDEDLTDLYESDDLYTWVANTLDYSNSEFNLLDWNWECDLFGNKLVLRVVERRR